MHIAEGKREGPQLGLKEGSRAAKLVIRVISCTVYMATPAMQHAASPSSMTGGLQHVLASG
jgi:hypothetical protein